MLNDKKYRLPRIWSNKELKKFSNIFKGHIINVSGWKDEDKEGNKYKDYFKNASKYTITNYKKEARGFQGKAGEIFLNLEKELPKRLINKFDVVFNHTTLEHIYNVKKAFKNLCKMSKDIVILVVPFLQEFHGNYGDYWRFSHQAVERMFKENEMNIIYMNYNNRKSESVYIFAIASKNASKWKEITKKYRKEKKYFSKLGWNAIMNNIIFRIKNTAKNLPKHINRRVK